MPEQVETMRNITSGTADRHSADEINIRELVHRVAQKWWVFVIVVGTFLVWAVVSLHLTQYSYTVAIEVTPAREPQQGISSNLGEVANLAGIGLQRNVGDTNFDLYLASMQSLQMAQRLSQEKDFLIHMFPNEWDDAKGKWVVPQAGFLGKVVLIFKKVLGVHVPKDQPVNPRRVLTYLQNRITVERRSDNPLVRISIECPDVPFARKLLMQLHREADKMMRQRALARANEYISYLKEQLTHVSLTEHRLALIEALSEQEKSRMAASSTLPFATEMFSGPVVSNGPTSPRPGLRLGLAIVAGIVLSLLLIGLGEVVSSYRRNGQDIG